MKGAEGTIQRHKSACQEEGRSLKNHINAEVSKPEAAQEAAQGREAVAGRSPAPCHVQRAQCS